MTFGSAQSANLIDAIRRNPFHYEISNPNMGSCRCALCRPGSLYTLNSKPREWAKPAVEAEVLVTRDSDSFYLALICYD